MKVLFLDVDGVLNNYFTKVYINKHHFVEDSKLMILQNIIKETDCKIVLSSSWRQGWEDVDDGCNITIDAIDYIALKDKLFEYNMVLFDKTPTLPSFNATRGEEIKKWLDEWNGEPITNIAILDDNTNMKPLGRYQLQTSIMKGIEEKHLNKIKKILTIPYQ